MQRGRRPRCGAALLEAIVAITILALAGSAFAALQAQSSDAIRQARRAEADLREGSAFLDVVALWPRADLDRRLGSREQGPWRLEIARPTPTRYELALWDSSGARLLLRTSIHRPEEAKP